jgi:hypothetical protein
MHTGEVLLVCRMGVRFLVVRVDLHYQDGCIGTDGLTTDDTVEYEDKVVL